MGYGHGLSYGRIHRYSECSIMSNQTIEQVAKAICKARGLEPNAVICPQMPQFIASNIMALYSGFYIPSKEHQMPAWKYFIQDAIAALRALSPATGQQQMDYFVLAKAEGYDDKGAVFNNGTWDRMVSAALVEHKKPE